MPSTNMSRVLACAFIALVHAIPSPKSIGSDVQILLHNDLYDSESSRQAAGIVLGTAQSMTANNMACAALGETLWTPPASLSSDNFLAYLAYQHGGQSSLTTPASPDTTPDTTVTPDNSKQPQLYFIASASNGQCQAITPFARVLQVSCNEVLPAICSQSAPYSSFNYTRVTGAPYSGIPEDTSAKWQTQVSSGNTAYTGFRDHLSFRFLGIKFGNIAQRYTYSTLNQPAGEVSALAYGPQCWQIDALYFDAEGAEDCLFLNVYTPYLPTAKAKKAQLKPVMFWIYGGGFADGEANDPTFDGGEVASRGDVVVVTINYRLGDFGFLVFGNGTGINGNQGLGDIVTALQWTQANIAAFGGDPKRVMIYGQSAGGAAVQAMLRSPPAAGLFSAAVQHSAGYSTYLPINQAIAQYTNPILNQTGCAGSDPAAELACLRSYDPAKLVSLRTISNELVVDGYYLTEATLNFNGTTHVNKVPLMIGNMHDEGGAFVPYTGTTNLTASLLANHDNISAIIGNPAFPLPSSSNISLAVFNATAQISTDGIRCSQYALAYAAAVTNTFPSVYYYENNRSYQIPYWPLVPNKQICNPTPTVQHPAGDPDLPFFKCHSGDLPVIFSTWRRWGLPDRNGFDTPYTQYVVDTWVAFARNHNPNPDFPFLAVRGYTNTTLQYYMGGQQQFKQVTKKSQTLRRLQWPSEQIGFEFAEQCEALGMPLGYLLPPGA